MPDLARRLAVARGDEPAELVVRGGRVFSAFTREWLEGDVAVVDGYVAGLGEYDGGEVLDASGRWVVPGFIDAHLHLESPKLLVDEFARLVLPLGTTAVVADPHEIANVLGTDGVHWLLDASAGSPLDVYFTASSSVPASQYESPRRALSVGDREARTRFARRRARARRPGSRPAGVRRGGHPLRPRGVDARRGTRAAPRGNVAADPRGVGCAQPEGAASARRR